MVMVIRLSLVAALSILAARLDVEAQSERTKPRIAVLYSGASIASISGANPERDDMRAFLEGMRELGWVDGQNITIERTSAEGVPGRYRALAQTMVDRRVDALVISGVPAFVLAAQQATRTIPIVMAGLAGDPVGLGFAKSLAAPGGNVTGSTFTIGSEIIGKRLQLLKEVAPGISRVAVLSQFEPDISTESAARALGLTLLWARIDASRGITEPLADIKQKHANALLVYGGPAITYQREIIAFAATHRLPAMYVLNDFVKAGGLLSYSASYQDIFRRSAGYVDKILKGAKPGDLPIEQPIKFDLVINMKTAKALSLTIPPSLLLRADHVIE